mgnify:CR=1 FL=1
MEGPSLMRMGARELRKLYDSVDFLLDIHSMSDPCPPLMLAGTRKKGGASRFHVRTLRDAIGGVRARAMREVEQFCAPLHFISHFS